MTNIIPSQTAVYQWLLDHPEGGTLEQIAKDTNYIPTGVSARIRELRRLYGVNISKHEVETKSQSRVFCYKLQE